MFISLVLATSIFYLALALVSQALGVFSYQVVVVAVIIFLIWVGFYIYKKRSITSYVTSVKKIFKTNWVVCIALALIATELALVHLSFTGTVQTFRGETTVTHDAYVYPFISDEWITVGLMKYSIESRHLPLVNPLDHNTPFPDLVFAFPAVMAQSALLLNLDPLLDYWILSVLVILILCFSAYVLLRKYNVSSFVAAATILVLPYITNSGNLQALWSLSPFTVGTVFLIWQLISQKSARIIAVFCFAILGLIMYPPIMIFSLPALIVWIIDLPKKRRSRIIMISGTLLGLGLALLFVYFLILRPWDMTFVGVIQKYFIHPSLDPGIVSFGIWNVVPVFILLFSAIGIYALVRRSQLDLLATVLVGLAYWIFYHWYYGVIIIEYPRIVCITSILLIVSAGYGMEWLVNKVSAACNKDIFIHYIRPAVIIVAVGVSLVLLPTYTAQSLWQKLPLNVKDQTGQDHAYIPAAPANRYLTDDDLRLFHDIHGMNIIAPPWKGLVIGIAEGDFPLESKAGTITNEFFPYSTFIEMNCMDKNQVAEAFQVGYVYSDPFSCPRFKEIGSSGEGLDLYAFR